MGGGAGEGVSGSEPPSLVVSPEGSYVVLVPAGAPGHSPGCAPRPEARQRRAADLRRRTGQGLPVGPKGSFRFRSAIGRKRLKKGLGDKKAGKIDDSGGFRGDSGFLGAIRGKGGVSKVGKGLIGVLRGWFLFLGG